LPLLSRAPSFPLPLGFYPPPVFPTLSFEVARSACERS
jgi:hypothetical protein